MATIVQGVVRARRNVLISGEGEDEEIFTRCGSGSGIQGIWLSEDGFTYLAIGTDEYGMGLFEDNSGPAARVVVPSGAWPAAVWLGAGGR